MIRRYIQEIYILAVVAALAFGIGVIIGEMRVRSNCPQIPQEHHALMPCSETPQYAPCTAGP